MPLGLNYYFENYYMNQKDEAFTPPFLYEMYYWMTEQ